MIEKIHSAQSFILTTHRHCDADGLGAGIALYHALRQMGKSVHLIYVDLPSERYDFLTSLAPGQLYDPSIGVPRSDLALIFDTNDYRLIEPLYSTLTSHCKSTLFIDHHPILAHGPEPTPGSIIQTNAASTGEIVFSLIQKLKVEITPPIARALYSSLAFDTQLFRYIKSSPRSHLIAAELLRVEKAPEKIHRHLFATYSIEKMQFLAQNLSAVEYFCNGKLAFVAIAKKHIEESGSDRDATGDIIDLLMNIETIEIAALLREEAPNEWKLSLRSKGNVTVLEAAERFAGGGHSYASGAFIKGEFNSIRKSLLDLLNETLAATLSWSDSDSNCTCNCKTGEPT
jgi:phosphoesterase RecJ-like protein